MSNLKQLILSATLFLPVFSAAVAAEEQKVVDGDKLVQEAAATLEELVADKKLEQFRANLKKAHGVMIVPKWTRAGLIIGGSGGNGVVLIRKDGEWRGPGFYEYGGGSVGAQIGVSVQRIVMLIMNERAISKLLSGKIKLGGGVSVAAGPVGAAQETGTTKGPGDDVDILSYGKAKGLYAGVVADGATMSMLDATSQAYYGKAVTPQEIFVDGSVKSDKSQALLDLLAKHSN